MYRILVCDDEEEIVSSLTACLTAEGYQTVTARTGWEVLDILSKQPIHLALLGTKLPGLDGLTTVTRLRQMQSGARDYIALGVTCVFLAAAIVLPRLI